MDIDQLQNWTLSLFRKSSGNWSQRRRIIVFVSALFGSLLATIWDNPVGEAIGNAIRFLVLGAAMVLVGLQVSSAAGPASGITASLSSVLLALSLESKSSVLTCFGAVASSAVSVGLVGAAEEHFELQNSDSLVVLLCTSSVLLGYLLVHVGTVLVVAAAGAGAGVLVGLALGVGLLRENFNVETKPRDNVVPIPRESTLSMSQTLNSAAEPAFRQFRRHDNNRKSFPYFNKTGK